MFEFIKNLLMIALVIGIGYAVVVIGYFAVNILIWLFPFLLTVGIICLIPYGVYCAFFSGK